MAENDLPEYYYKLGVEESIFAKAISKMLEDFNVYMDEEKALRLFYNLNVNLMHYLDVHPGFYYKLKYLDITSDEDNFLIIRRTSDVTDELIDIPYLYNKFCSEEMVREELDKNLDLFAQSILSVKEKKDRIIHTLDKLIYDKKKVVAERNNLTSLVKQSKKQRKAVMERRKADLKTLKREIRRKYLSYFSTPIDKKHRETENARYKRLEAELKERWNADKNNFPLK